MLRVLVLGSTGFIGRNLVTSLSQKDGIALTVFGRKLRPDPDPRAVRAVAGNFEDPAALRLALKDQDLVYHCISQTIPASSWDDPLAEIEKNLTPSLKLIEIAAQCGVKKICFASSGGTVYGLRQDLLSEANPTEPFSPHGIVKRSIESFLQYARLRHRIGYDVYRISNVYGEGQDVGKGLGFINTALENIAAGRPVVVYGDGSNTRDYIHVKDVAKLLALSVRKDFADSDVYNVSSNYAISLNDLITLIRRVTRADFRVERVPGRPSDNRRVSLDNSKIMRFFEDAPLTSLEEGVRDTYLDIRKKLTRAQKGC